MSSFNLLKNNYTSPERRKLTNQYFNDYNYFNKNNIKMSIWRQNHLNQSIKEKREKAKQFHLPKMLYSNLFLGAVATEPNKKDFYSDLLNGDVKYDKNSIETAAQIKEKIDGFNTSHVKRQVGIFDDLLDCVDNLEINTGDNESNCNKDEKVQQTSNSESITNNAIKQSLMNEENKETFTELNNANTNENTVNSANNNSLLFITKPNYKQSLPSIMENDEVNLLSKNRSNSNFQISRVTDLTDDSLVKKLRSDPRSYRNPIQFGNYYKYKYTNEGVIYPKQKDKHNLPEYDGESTGEVSYFNYRKKIYNPNKIYNSIGSFGEKFNRELGRISHSYGKEESKGRFVPNPLLKSYQEQIPYYELYKDIKFIENRYTDNKRYKYKLLPLVNAKLRNFDRLGEKIYQQSLMKKQSKNITIDNRTKN